MQSTVVAVAVERHNPSAWKLGWDIHLLSVAYCVCFYSLIMHSYTCIDRSETAAIN